MRFEDINYSDSELQKRSLIKGCVPKTCFICGSNTHYTDSCSGMPICSEECQKREMFLLAKNRNKE